MHNEFFAKELIQQIVNNSLLTVQQPLVTEGSIQHDFLRLQLGVQQGLDSLDEEDLGALFPIMLVLAGCEVKARNEHAGHVFWTIKLPFLYRADTISYGAYVSTVEELEQLRLRFNEDQAKVVLWGCSPSLSKSVSETRVGELTFTQYEYHKIVLCLAVYAFADEYLYSLLSSLDMRIKLHDVLEHALELPWRQVEAVNQRWHDL